MQDSLLSEELAEATGAAGSGTSAGYESVSSSSTTTTTAASNASASSWHTLSSSHEHTKHYVSPPPPSFAYKTTTTTTASTTANNAEGNNTKRHKTKGGSEEEVVEEDVAAVMQDAESHAVQTTRAPASTPSHDNSRHETVTQTATATSKTAKTMPTSSSSSLQQKQQQQEEERHASAHPRVYRTSEAPASHLSPHFTPTPDALPYYHHHHHNKGNTNYSNDVPAASSIASSQPQTHTETLHAALPLTSTTTTAALQRQTSAGGAMPDTSRATAAAKAMAQGKTGGTSKETRTHADKHTTSNVTASDSPATTTTVTPISLLSSPALLSGQDSMHYSSDATTNSNNSLTTHSTNSRHHHNNNNNTDASTQRTTKTAVTLCGIKPPSILCTQTARYQPNPARLYRPVANTFIERWRAKARQMGRELRDDLDDDKDEDDDTKEDEDVAEAEQQQQEQKEKECSKREEEVERRQDKDSSSKAVSAATTGQTHEPRTHAKANTLQPSNTTPPEQPGHTERLAPQQQQDTQRDGLTQSQTSDHPTTTTTTTAAVTTRRVTAQTATQAVSLALPSTQHHPSPHSPVRRTAHASPPPPQQQPPHAHVPDATSPTRISHSNNNNNSGYVSNGYHDEDDKESDEEEEEDEEELSKSSTSRNNSVVEEELVTPQSEYWSSALRQETPQSVSPPSAISVSSYKPGSLMLQLRATLQESNHPSYTYTKVTPATLTTPSHTTTTTTTTAHDAVRAEVGASQKGTGSIMITPTTMKERIRRETSPIVSFSASTPARRRTTTPFALNTSSVNSAAGNGSSVAGVTENVTSPRRANVSAQSSATHRGMAGQGAPGAERLDMSSSRRSSYQSRTNSSINTGCSVSSISSDKEHAVSSLMRSPTMSSFTSIGMYQYD